MEKETPKEIKEETIEDVNEDSILNEPVKEEDISSYGPKKIEKHLFMQWLAIPTRFRSPKTQKAFSQKYGVSEQMLCYWKNDDEFLKEVSIYRKKRYINKISDVIDSLANRAIKTGDGKECKLMMEYTGEYTEKKDVSVSGLAELLKETQTDDEPLVK